MFANKQETLTHFSQQYCKWDNRRDSIWVTADGKLIDDTVMYELAEQGCFTRKFHGAAAYGDSSNMVTDKGIAAGFWGSFFQALAQCQSRVI